jgi:hypothetical protein
MIEEKPLRNIYQQKLSHEIEYIRCRATAKRDLCKIGER